MYCLRLPLREPSHTPVGSFTLPDTAVLLVHCFHIPPRQPSLRLARVLVGARHPRYPRRCRHTAGAYHCASHLVRSSTVLVNSSASQRSGALLALCLPLPRRKPSPRCSGVPADAFWASPYQVYHPDIPPSVLRSQLANVSSICDVTSLGTARAPR